MNSRNEGTLVRSALSLTVVIIVCSAVAFWPARMLAGDVGVRWMTVAAVTCLVPGWIALSLSWLSVFPNELSAMLVQSMVRLGCVAAVAVIVRTQWPALGLAEFFGWLIGFYLLALLAEVLLIRRMAGSSDDTNGE